MHLREGRRSDSFNENNNNNDNNNSIMNHKNTKKFEFFILTKLFDIPISSSDNQ